MMTGMVADGVTVTIASNEPDGQIANANLASAMDIVRDTLTEKIGAAGGILKFDDNVNAYSIIRSNGRVTASLDIKINQSASVSDVQSRVDAEMATLLNTEQFKAWGIAKIEDGFSKQFAETMSQMVLALVLGLILVYLVMVAMFQSFKLPFVVMVTIPLAFTGAFFLLCVTGMTFSIVAVIGLVILMGVIVNNGIVLIDYIGQARGDGLSIQDAVIAGAKTRARPILMTALTTIIALIPSAMGMGSSGAMMQPLAIASIGGLFYATAMSLFVVPAFYVIMFCRKDRQEKRNMLQQSTGEGNEKNNSSKLENEHDARTVNSVLCGIKGKKS
jgi:multidrug efflux pump subunit AcrB